MASVHDEDCLFGMPKVRALLFSLHGGNEMNGCQPCQSNGSYLAANLGFVLFAHNITILVSKQKVLAINAKPSFHPAAIPFA